MIDIFLVIHINGKTVIAINNYVLRECLVVGSIKDHNGNKCVHFLCYPNI